MLKSIVAALFLTGVFAPAAAASYVLEERTIPSKTTTFRGLIITDASGTDDSLLIAPTSPLEPPQLLISTPSGFANIPPGCGAHEILQPSVACPVADYDIVGIETGEGNDDVSIRVPHPALTRKQIRSPSTAVFFSTILGPGRDRLSSPAPGTDYAAGGPGKDRIATGPSNDYGEGGGGADRLSGGGGLDQLFGLKGPDKLAAGPGVPDLSVGGRGRDRCAGDARDLVASCERIRIR